MTVIINFITKKCPYTYKINHHWSWSNTYQSLIIFYVYCTALFAKSFQVRTESRKDAHIVILLQFGEIQASLNEIEFTWTPRSRYLCYYTAAVSHQIIRSVPLVKFSVIIAVRSDPGSPTLGRHIVLLWHHKHRRLC